MSLLDELSPIILRYEDQQTRRLAEYEQRTAQLQAQSVPAARDPELRDRLLPLKAAQHDTLLREAGVVLENRLRTLMGEEGSQLHGVKLVDAAFDHKTGKIQVSNHAGEQDGIRMLYRGAIQFLRNPSMHRLIDHQDAQAAISIGLIDSLLLLLHEVTGTHSADANGKTKPWGIEQLKNAYGEFANVRLATRLGEILDWAQENRLFVQSTGKTPNFGIKGRSGKRVLSFFGTGGMYFFLAEDRYPNEAQRQNAFEFYQRLRFISRHENLVAINDGRYSQRMVDELSDREYQDLLSFLHHFNE